MVLNAGVREVWSTDCVKHASNAISMSSPIAQALIGINAATMMG